MTPERSQPQARKGKRELNAEALRRRILDAARRLFSEIGYQAATITRIREAAEVSIATFYKYFDRKQAILIALLDDEHEVDADAVTAAIAAPIGDPADYIISIIGAALDPPEDDGQKALWREIVAASILMSGEAMGVEGMATDRASHSAQMRQALHRLVEAGKLAPHAPTASLVDILYCLSSLELQEFVCQRYKDRAAFFAHLHTTVKALLSPWLTVPPSAG